MDYSRAEPTTSSMKKYHFLWNIYLANFISNYALFRSFKRIIVKSKWVWSGNTTITKCRPTIFMGNYALRMFGYFNRIIVKRKWVWSGNTTITKCRPTYGTLRTSHRTCTVTKQPKDNKSHATSYLFQVKMISKLERTQNNAQQNKDKHRIPTNNGRYIKQ